jgi:enoyl-CoA hydratase
MSHETIEVVRRGGVEQLTLNRPESLNAMNGRMVRELHAYFTGLPATPEVRVVLVRGAGRGFSAGLDMREVAGQADTSHIDLIPGLLEQVTLCPQIVVSLVHGPAAGGGFLLALASDLRIAGESAKMSNAFIKLGLSGCELGFSFLLPRLVGMTVAAELMMTGRALTAARALQLGLVNEVTPDAELNAAGHALADDLMKATPLGLRMTKETLRRASRIDDLMTVIDFEARRQSICANGPDFREKVAAFAAARAGSAST